jgi:hypothetical protein
LWEKRLSTAVKKGPFSAPRRVGLTVTWITRTTFGAPKFGFWATFSRPFTGLSHANCAGAENLEK